MENYNVSGEWKQPYRTHTCLWEKLETDALLEEMDNLEDQLKTTALASRMLKDIGIKIK